MLRRLGSDGRNAGTGSVGVHGSLFGLAADTTPASSWAWSSAAFHLLPVTVNAASGTGPKLSFVIHLARWVWH